MELTSRLYDAFMELAELKRHLYKYIVLSVNRTKLIGMSMSVPCRNDILEMNKIDCLNHMEEKLKMLKIPSTTVCWGSPLYGFPMELRIMSQTGKAVTLYCGFQEYPQCCGSIIMSPMSIMGNSIDLGDEIWLVLKAHLNLCLSLVEILGYSHASCIISQGENPEYYSHLKQITALPLSECSHFTNAKTGNQCALLSFST